MVRTQLTTSSTKFSERIGGFYRRHGLGEAGQDALHEYGNYYAKIVGPLPETVDQLGDGGEVRIDGRRWRILVGRGHTPEHLSLYCQELGVLISGDQVLPRITTNISVPVDAPESNPLAEYLDSLEALRELPETVLVLPSHGLVFSGLHARIRELKAHHSERLAELHEACAEPRTAASLLPVLFRRQLTDAHSLFFAMGECIAHLNYLRDRGGLRRLEKDGVYHFQAA